MNATFKTVLLWLSLVIVIFLAYHFAQIQKKEAPLKFSEFMTQVETGKVQDVTITGSEIKGHFANRRGVPDLRAHGLRQAGGHAALEEGRRSTACPTRPRTWANMLISWAPFMLLIGFWIFFMRQMQSGGNKALSFGKSKAKLLASQQKKVTFKDVAGVDEAKEELQEIIEFLREPQKFQKLGGRIPKGVLLMGPPGHGQDPAGPRHRRRGERARSSPSPAPTSWRCSWAWARRACATSSSRGRRTRPASSSSTRSTPWDAIAARAWAAATTSASRR